MIISQAVPAAVLLMTSFTMTDWQELTEPQDTLYHQFEHLADCESGEWIDSGRDFIDDSARWDYQYGKFQGGLQFHPQTWQAYKDDFDPQHAYDASKDRQIVVAKRVLADQGWRAWPTCSRLLGYLK